CGLAAGNSFARGVDALDVLAGALADGEATDLDPPSCVTLVNLPYVLAGAEAIALSGTQASAIRWLDCLEAIPSNIITCIEWPVVVDRVRALLACRSGNLIRGIRLVRSAAKTAATANLPLEQAISLVQLSEMLSAAPSAARRREWGR